MYLQWQVNLDHIVTVMKQMPQSIRGFSINVGSFVNTSFNEQLASEIHCQTGMHFIIDTSRNGGEFSSRCVKQTILVRNAVFATNKTSRKKLFLSEIYMYLFNNSDSNVTFTHILTEKLTSNLLLNLTLTQNQILTLKKKANEKRAYKNFSFSFCFF